MDEIQECRNTNMLGKIVSYLMIGTFGGAMIMLIVSSILFARTLSVSRSVKASNETALLQIKAIQDECRSEIDRAYIDYEDDLVEIKKNITNIENNIEHSSVEVTANQISKNEVIIDEEIIRKVVAEYMDESRKNTTVEDDSADYDDLINRETEMLLGIMELLVGELEK